MPAVRPAFVDLLFGLLFAVFCGWLTLSVFLIDGETGDGYLTIKNTRFLFGDSPYYAIQRGPLYPFLLGPAEWVVSWLDLFPMDARPYHAVTAVIHGAYLWGVWKLLQRLYPDLHMARLIGFTAAICSVIFFCYAQYISHDIFPGLVFLLLILSVWRWIERPSWWIALVIVLLGASMPLLKQTWAIFWLSVLLSLFVLYVVNADAALTKKKLFLLGSMAAASAMITWVGYGLFLVWELPGWSVFLRPIPVIKAILNQFSEDPQQMFPAGIYLDNLHNYGWLTMGLLLPSLYLAFKHGDIRLKLIALCWICGFLLTQLITYKEVRYLAFLAPLSAVLIVPTVALVLEKHRSLAMVMVAILVFDLSRGFEVAATNLASAPQNRVSRFLSILDGASENDRVLMTRYLSFAHYPQSPLKRDRYHGIYHFAPDIVRNFFPGVFRVESLKDPRALREEKLSPADKVLFSNMNLVRHSPWDQNNRPNELESFVQAAGIVEKISLTRRGDIFVAANRYDRPIMLVPAGASEQPPVIFTQSLPASTVRALFGDKAAEDEFEVSVVIVSAYCQASRCHYYES